MCPAPYLVGHSDGIPNGEQDIRGIEPNQDKVLIHE